MTNTQQAGYGRGEHAIDVELVSHETVSKALRDTFGAEGYRPPVLPAVALRVYELTRRLEVDIDEICRVIETDALLSADVLRVAQSGGLARSTPARSIREAAMRLGSNTLRDHVFRVSLESRVFRSEHFQGSMESVRRHSVAVGEAARTVTEESSHSPDYAFLAGLLHDIGLAAGLLVFDGWEKAGRYPGDELAVTGLMQVHAEVGEQIASLWNLPPEVQWIVGAHHVGRIQGYQHPIASACIIAESIVGELGFGVEIGAVSVDSPDPHALRLAAESLGIDHRVRERLTEKLAAQLL